METIKIKYFDNDIDKLGYIGGATNPIGLTFVLPKESI